MKASYLTIGWDGRRRPHDNLAVGAGGSGKPTPDAARRGDKTPMIRTSWKKTLALGVAVPFVLLALPTDAFASSIAPPAGSGLVGAILAHGIRTPAGCSIPDPVSWTVPASRGGAIEVATAFTDGCALVVQGVTPLPRAVAPVSMCAETTEGDSLLAPLYYGVTCPGDLVPLSEGVGVPDATVDAWDLLNGGIYVTGDPSAGATAVIWTAPTWPNDGCDTEATAQLTFSDGNWVGHGECGHDNYYSMDSCQGVAGGGSQGAYWAQQGSFSDWYGDSHGLGARANPDGSCDFTWSGTAHAPTVACGSG